MITRKIKIGNFFYSLSRSIQNIAHHSQSLFDGVISEGGGVCMSLSRKKPQFFFAKWIKCFSTTFSKSGHIYMKVAQPDCASCPHIGATAHETLAVFFGLSLLSPPSGIAITHENIFRIPFRNPKKNRSWKRFFF